jgi:hypothetical protein
MDGGASRRLAVRLITADCSGEGDDTESALPALSLPLMDDNGHASRSLVACSNCRERGASAERDVSAKRERAALGLVVALFVAVAYLPWPAQPASARTGETRATVKERSA